ncbi:nitric oxide reductase activation protein NorD [Nocardia gamkensis]|uniref:VWA domain-containing protein n=1 Tax=Nocardia gamkensis TaxID=352869 RepID=A0A7X6L0Z0_9NOCA|nr:VWA domain-containing protein [Nocardia gamkensis]NKY25857.1 VWA domain-containing protein [Nocardia gamkensis]
MAVSDAAHALSVERSCALTAVAFSGRRREGVRLVTGERRGFGLNSARGVVLVPFPPIAPSWTRKTLTCGVALQCSPSKDRIARYALHELSPRQLGALSLVEGRVAAGWMAERFPGLLPELCRLVPDLEIADPDLGGAEMLDRALDLARSGQPLARHPLLGDPPLAAPARGALATAVRRVYGRMPWTSSRSDRPRLMSVPVGGDGGSRSSNLPPPSRPENEDIEIRPDRRAGIPYPEWNLWTETFLRDHVAVLERRHPTTSTPAAAVSPEVRRWFEQPTYRAMRGGLEDGCDLDIDHYVDHYVDRLTGKPGDPRIFRDLLPISRDVATALLLDGSSSLGINGGRGFRLELECADALSRAMTEARERHAIFVFTGNTRHRVEVNCLKDFDDFHFVDPSGLGLLTAGYTRLGAPLRHLTRRLLDQPAERRLLIVMGDGLMSDEGYEGRYAWADVTHALEEADEAGVSIYYIGVGPTRVDPLPEVFGTRRSRRIRQVEELPRVLAHIHRELVAQ